MDFSNWKACPLCQAPFSREALERAPLRCAQERCGFEAWNSPVPVVAVLVEFPEGVLLAHHRSWPPKVLAPITGFIEAREDPATAARREAREELGLEIESPELLGVYGFAAQNQLIVAFHARASGQVTLGEELDDFRIVPVARLKPWNFGTGLAVADFLARRSRAQE